VGRTEAGYRRYSDNEVHTLRFIKRSRDLGFSMVEIADLLKLWQDRRRPSASVKRVASAHLAELDRKIAQMESMRKTLQNLVHCCHGNERPDCPILDELGGVPLDGGTPSRLPRSTECQFRTGDAWWVGLADALEFAVGHGLYAKMGCSAVECAQAAIKNVAF